ncbi:MAG: transglutaminase domain-containing protein [Saprospiraceae bacterium]|nr:transglutaminase domain-containing protein [Saprospiraceae bacterium]
MRIIPFFICCFFCATTFAQSKMTIIPATSKLVSIQEGDNFSKNSWTITPDLKPDIYYTKNKNVKVTFFTDKGQYSVKVKSGKKYDFIILLNNKDTAWTQIICDESKFPKNYLSILKKADKYNTEEKREIPKFTYQSADHPSLVALRKGFNLDSIAGEGNEISKILHLLHWIHELIPHDGNHGNPEVKNAMNMIAVCKNEHRGLNCRGLGTVLNECYLAMGFKSRFITCMPKDSVFEDCHVINMVYSNDLEKWIWVDPTHDAYVMDENGDLLSVEEVRARLINGKPLILNPTANWNKKSTTTKKEYLYNYMAKNLYRIECPLNSEYDVETRLSGKKAVYVELLPLDGLNQTPIKKEVTNKTNNVTFINYITNNPAVFWAKPE